VRINRGVEGWAFRRSNATPSGYPLQVRTPSVALAFGGGDLLACGLSASIPNAKSTSVPYHETLHHRSAIHHGPCYIEPLGLIDNAYGPYSCIRTADASAATVEYFKCIYGRPVQDMKFTHCWVVCETVRLCRVRVFQTRRQHHLDRYLIGRNTAWAIITDPSKNIGS
jgi:hypothetical protein